jgi:transposase
VPASTLTRPTVSYRRALIHDRTRQMQRLEKLLEDAQIKLSSVAADIFLSSVAADIFGASASGRAMLEALIGGQRDPKVLAQLARRRLRAKLAALEEALRGFFTDHHAAILRMMLDNIDRRSEQIAALDTTIEQAIAPFARQVSQLDEITGVGATAAQELIAEVASTWAASPPPRTWCRGPSSAQTHQSAGKKRDKGRGKQRAMVATGNSVLVIVYHLLADPDARFGDLGADHYETLRVAHRQATQGPQPRLAAPSSHRPIVICQCAVARRVVAP